MTAQQEPPEKRIPTIPPHIEFPDRAQKAKRKLILHPTKEEVAAVLNRIRQQKKLSDELEGIEADLPEIAHLVALNLHYMGAWRERVTWKGSERRTTDGKQ